jgi:aryl sulfotransferase
MSKEMNSVKWPKKSRELFNNHIDSTIWNDFSFRDDDVFIATYVKSGTTWVQQIVSQLIFNGETGLDVADMSPWIDFRLPPKEIKLAAIENQQHRRFLKTHLPLDALVYSPKAKYLYIARDGRDVLWSYYHHHSTQTESFYTTLNKAGGPDIKPFEPPCNDIVEYYRVWLEQDGYPIWSFWENIATWWKYRHLPNLLMLNFGALKKDMPGEIRRIAEFLEISIDESKWNTILEHCSFDYMKAHAEQIVPMGGVLWEGGAKTFINKGTNGRWRDVLSEADSARYESLALEKLGSECTHWLATGEMLK